LAVLDANLQEQIRQAVRRYAADAIALSIDIHRHPELAFQEHHAVEAITGLLAREGFGVTRPVAGLDTAFTATWGEGEPRVAYLLEYDALPGLGHACGHNLIAAGGAAAALALAAAWSGAGQIVVVGTPGEEGGGGKIVELEAGVFDGVDACLMFHPGDRTLPWRASSAAAHVRIAFEGLAAHAAKDPEAGRNALDAILLTYAGINALRQHMGEKARIHGVIRHGGDAPNVVPAFADAEFLVRDVDLERAERLVGRVEDIARGAGLATGTQLTVERLGPTYSERKNNKPMASRIGEHLSALGHDVGTPSPDEPGGSSDIGNVSLRVPSIHPYLQIVDRGVPGHSEAFRDAAVEDRAHQALLDMSTALAWAGAELLSDPGFLRATREDFEHSGPDLMGAGR
jgi:amidohydrolase